ncbi:Lysophospholipase L2 [Candidatus Phaeomarinobacter ectocarpi]|uniref:Lysophospholipase L2 n=1 Tax=Candidatus Phaeomarinibacter ectocarpi TaxID=1458461 RepID=X5MKY5_9HYPH|nr:alpha/beta hydrolase [Candidatus Phaeomarinobacter ectocarpi]CDO59000.1 Lysophospholipase L2 [Candidatus Phaeomarinobacter ectocarpi]
MTSPSVTAPSPTSGADLTDIPENPCPAGADAFWFDGYDGKPMRGAVWPATGAQARGTVLLFGGRTEFIEKYFEVVTQLRDRGFAVASMDWRGQGLSARGTENRLKGHIDHFNEFDRDMAKFVKLVGERNLPQPLIGMAHSMGGNNLMRWLHLADTDASLAAGLPKMKGVALSAPMVDLRLSTGAMLSMRLMGFTGIALGLGDKYLPGGGDDKAVGLDAFEDNIVTSDPERFARQVAIVKANSDLALASITLGWAGSAAESIDLLQSDSFVASIKTPVLFAGAEKDVLVSEKQVAAYARRVRGSTYVKCDGCKHEILMERDELQAPFWSAFDDFAESVLA